MGDIEVPASLDLLDVAGNGVDCERFLWIRGLSDPTLPPRARIDLVDDLRRLPGELLHLASRDGTTAATAFTIRDERGAGSCYLTIHSRTDPGEPTLGDLVQLAAARARAAGVAQVRCGDGEDRPHIAALRERHGFREHERWRRFHVETDHAPASARLVGGRLPDEVRVATLAARPGLAETAFAVHRAGLADAAGDFPRPDETAAGWLHALDSSPVRDRELVLLLLDHTDEVLALVELERVAMGSDHARVELLAVPRRHRGRGYGRLARQVMVEHARELRIRRVESMNHADNAAVCAINESLGWIEDPQRVALSRDA